MSCPFFMQLKNLGFLCLRLLERSQWRIRAPFVFNISFPSGNNFKADRDSQPLTGFLLTPNATTHHQEPCLSFHLSHLIAPSAITGWLSWELGSEKASRSRKFTEENSWRSGQMGRLGRDAKRKTLFLSVLSTR